MLRWLVAKCPLCSCHSITCVKVTIVMGSCSVCTDGPFKIVWKCPHSKNNIRDWNFSLDYRNTCMWWKMLSSERLEIFDEFWVPRWCLHFTLMKGPSPKCQLSIYIIPAVHKLNFHTFIDNTLPLQNTILSHCWTLYWALFTVSNRIFVKSIGGVPPTWTNSRHNNKMWLIRS